MMEKEIILKIEGNEFSGWQSAEVSKGLNQLAGAFAMSYTDKATIPIKMGQECTVEINGHVLITGHVEYIDSRFNGTMHQLQVRGRDKLGDLVDCCFYDKDNLHSGEFKDESVLNIVKRLCEPYDVDVVLDETDSSLVEEHLSTKKINFSVETGETIADCLVRLSKMHAFLPVGYDLGQLQVASGAGGKFIIEKYGYSITRAFPEFNISGDDGLEDLVGEVIFNFTGNLVRKVVALVKHGQEEALDTEVGVKCPLDSFYGVQQLAKSFQCVVFTLNRYKNRMSRCETVNCKQPQRRGAINKNILIFCF